MPRRSSSQNHRLVDLYKQAEQGQKPTPRAEPNETNDQSTYLSSQSEETAFNFEEWSLQCWATRLAIPRGSLRSQRGRRIAEKIDQHLQKGDLPAALELREEGRLNRCPSPAERRSYDEKLFKQYLMGPNG